MTRAKKPLRPGPKPRGGETSRPLTIRATASERIAWERAAGDRPLGEWIRDRLNAATK